MTAIVGGFLSWLTHGLPAFLFVITIVIFFHELGHFLMARTCGVNVKAFSIGFGRELFGWNDRRNTRWKLCLLPIGGYVQFAGDADPSSSRPNDEEIKEASPEERARMYHARPLYQRALVSAAGPVANFILAIVIFAGVFMVTPQPAEPPIIADITPGSAAEAAGLKPGDTILAIEGRRIVHYSDLQEIVAANIGKELHVEALRDGKALELLATPRPVEIPDAGGKTRTIGRLGITDSFVSLGPSEAIWRATTTTWGLIRQTFDYLSRLIIGHASPDQLSGPIGIAKASGDVASIGFFALLRLTALISVAIGFANLLPIPVLDGGHLLYYAFEAVLGRPLGERAQEMGFRLGLAFVLCLMLLATFNDLVRFNLF